MILEHPLINDWVYIFRFSTYNKMGCFNDPAWKVCGWGGWVADTNYLYPARWGWINNLHPIKHNVQPSEQLSMKLHSSLSVFYKCWGGLQLIYEIQYRFSWKINKFINEEKGFIDANFHSQVIIKFQKQNGCESLPTVQMII